jgi:hypothetical protein
MNARRRLIHLLTLAALASIAVAPTQADVVVTKKYHDDDGRVIALYVLRIIVDDPDPVSRYRISQASEGPSKRLANAQILDDIDGEPQPLRRPTTGWPRWRTSGGWESIGLEPFDDYTERELSDGVESAPAPSHRSPTKRLPIRNR